MPKLKEVEELIDSDPNLGEQIAVFGNDNKNNSSSEEE
jgi:hypothetical protein